MIRSCLATVLVAFVWMTSCADENDDLFWREIRKDGGVGGVMDCRKEGEHPYSSLPEGEKARLLLLARCARSAYPGVEPPKEFRAFSGDDWKNCVLGRRYEGFRFDNDGYLYVGSGLRARFLENRKTHDLVVAWSGCDLKDLANGNPSGIADAITVVRQYIGDLADGQFEQAAKIFNGLILFYPGRRIDVVGHSLGGAIATYVVAVASDTENRVYGTTFNGLGLSLDTAKQHMRPWRTHRAKNLIVNVKCDTDPVYAGVLVKSVHYGPTYSLPYSGGISHAMAQLISLMEQQGR